MPWTKTFYWHPLERDRVQCDVCPRDCTLHEGQRGLCFVRMNHGGEVALTTYGRTSGFCIDPIEKKPLNHFLPGSSVLSFGTAGCNLICKFCQNWDISKSHDGDRLSEEATPEMIALMARAHGCKSVAYTFNDPVIFFEYAIDTAQACHAVGIRSVAVTAGYMNEKPREEFFRSLDAANVDLKSFSESFYHTVCGGHLQPVLDTLMYLKNETHVWLEITTFLIPDANDSETELEGLTQWIAMNLGAEVPLHFTAFHPDWKMTTTPKTPVDRLRKARDIAQRNGIRYVYTGNVFDPQGQSTYCHRCHACLIERSGYAIRGWFLDADGCCMNCHTRCAGVFDSPRIHNDK